MVALTATVQKLTAQLESSQAQLIAALAANTITVGNGGRNHNRYRTPNPYAKGKHYC